MSYLSYFASYATRRELAGIIEQIGLLDTAMTNQAEEKKAILVINQKRLEVKLIQEGKQNIGLALTIISLLGLIAMASFAPQGFNLEAPLQSTQGAHPYCSEIKDFDTAACHLSDQVRYIGAIKNGLPHGRAWIMGDDGSIFRGTFDKRLITIESLKTPVGLLTGSYAEGVLTGVVYCAIDSASFPVHWREKISSEALAAFEALAGFTYQMCEQVTRTSSASS